MSSFGKTGQGNNDKQKYAVLTNRNTGTTVPVTYFMDHPEVPFFNAGSGISPQLPVTAAKRRTMAEAIETTRINDLVERIGNLRRYL